MSNVVHFPQRSNNGHATITENKPNLFSDLSDLLGIDMKKIVIDDDIQETKKLEKKLQKDSLKIRSK
jgi:hypothetical protein